MTSDTTEIGDSLRSTAISGGLWTFLQVLCNKGASLVGTVVLMYLLRPEAFGLANLAIGVVGCVTVIAPFTMGDVLIARRADIWQLRGTAWRICAIVTASTLVLVMVIAPSIASSYQQPALVVACAWACLRPVSDFLAMMPLTELRSRLQFRRIATVDAGTQIGAVCTSVAMAALGAGYVAILLPTALATASRTLFYRQNPSDEPTGRNWSGSEWRSLSRDFLLTGIGQYVHGGIVFAAPLIIGWYSDERNVGWYSMAFLLSGSINQVISVSIGGVLQPVFSHMQGNRNRQAAAFLRATSVTVAVGIPLCLIQAAVAGAAFALFLPDRWMPVVPMLQVLLIGQCFYISVSPAMGLLKAQGRFATFLWWQLAQFIFTVLAMWAYGSMVTNDPALGIVAILALANVIFAPVGLLLCMRETGVGAARALSTSLFPMAIAAISVGSVYALMRLACFARFGPTIGWVADIALIPPLAGGCYLLLLRLCAPTLLHDCAAIGKPIVRSFRRFMPIGRGSTM